MKKFNGFPARMQFTSVPNLFFSALVPHIDDIGELKTTLHVVQMLYQKKGYPRFVTFKELAANWALMSGFSSELEPESALRRALALALQRGSLLKLTMSAAEAEEDLYFLNTESDRQAVEKIQAGSLKLGKLKAVAPAEAAASEKTDIFTLYEQNIGQLTPLAADELRDAATQYPEAWITEAIKEAVKHNKRSISYVRAILERWSSEGKADGTHQGDSQKADPDKYIKGKYGHMVDR
jgi:DNA replication protein